MREIIAHLNYVHVLVVTIAGFISAAFGRTVRCLATRGWRK